MNNGTAFALFVGTLALAGVATLWWTHMQATASLQNASGKKP